MRLNYEALADGQTTVLVLQNILTSLGALEHANGRVSRNHDGLDARQFTLAVKKLADSLSYGSDHSPFLGSGIEYAQSRPYQWGDPVRAIDWRVTARTGKPFVKEYEAPKRLPCYLLLDTSASMTVGAAARNKYGLAVHLAGGLAFACLNRASPVGIVGVGGRELRLEPSLSADRVMQWLHLLRRFRYDETTAIGRRIADLAPTLSNRVLVLVLSDLHDPEALPALKLLAQKHDCVVFQIQDTAERGLHGGGFLRAREAETGRAFVTRAARPWLDPEETAGQPAPGRHRSPVAAQRPAVQGARAAFLQVAKPLWPRGAVRHMRVLVCGTLVVLWLCSGPAYAEEQRERTVGLPGRIEGLVLPGPELEVRPLGDRSRSLVLRIVRVWSHGTAFRYDLEYYGLEPGNFDLRSLLRHKDGSAIGDVPAIPIVIRSVLPPGQVLPSEVQPSPAPWLGGYFPLLIGAGVLWALGLLAILLVGRRKRRSQGRRLPPGRLPWPSTCGRWSRERLPAGWT